MNKKVLIIGGVAAGCKDASRIKRLDAEAEVTILEKGGIVSYGGCGLPYFIADVIKDEKELISTAIGVVRDASYFKNVKGVTVHINTCAEEIDRQKKVVKAGIWKEEPNVTQAGGYKPGKRRPRHPVHKHDGPFRGFQQCFGGRRDDAQS